MADGLTVPFALAAGLSGTVSETWIIVVAGIAEIAAGSIAMGLGGYLAARTDRDHYLSEVDRETRETVELPHKEREEVAEIFRGYGMSDQDIAPVVQAIASDQKRWVDFMMRFELGLEEPDPKRARNSAATIAVSYILGGMVPLAPYMLNRQLYTALGWSVAVTLVGPVRLRVREGAADGDFALARRISDGRDRRTRLGRGVRPGTVDPVERQYVRRHTARVRSSSVPSEV